MNNKGNPNHDEKGRFTSGSNSSGSKLNDPKRNPFNKEGNIGGIDKEGLSESWQKMFDSAQKIVERNPNKYEDKVKRALGMNDKPQDKISAKIQEIKNRIDEIDAMDMPGAEEDYEREDLVNKLGTLKKALNHQMGPGRVNYDDTYEFLRKSNPNAFDGEIDDETYFKMIDDVAQNFALSKDNATEHVLEFVDRNTLLNKVDDEVDEKVSFEDEDIPSVLPSHHSEKGHVVIDDGIHKGETYDNEEDLKNTLKNEEKANKEKIIGLLSQGNPNKEKVLEDYNKMSDEAKQKILDYIRGNEAEKSLEKLYEQNKTSIVQKYREVLPEFFQKVGDDELWKNMDLETKKKYFNK